MENPSYDTAGQFKPSEPGGVGSEPDRPDNGELVQTANNHNEADYDAAL